MVKSCVKCGKDVPHNKYCLKTKKYCSYKCQRAAAWSRYVGKKRRAHTLIGKGPAS